MGFRVDRAPLEQREQEHAQLRRPLDHPSFYRLKRAFEPFDGIAARVGGLLQRADPFGRNALDHGTQQALFIAKIPIKTRLRDARLGAQRIDAHRRVPALGDELDSARDELLDRLSAPAGRDVGPWRVSHGCPSKITFTTRSLPGPFWAGQARRPECRVAWTSSVHRAGSSAF